MEVILVKIEFFLRGDNPETGFPQCQNKFFIQAFGKECGKASAKSGIRTQKNDESGKNRNKREIPPNRTLFIG
jgi:hypothetical protein